MPSGGKMKDNIAAVHKLGQEWLVGHGVDLVTETRMRLKMIYVLDRSRREIIQDKDVVASIEQGFGQM